MKHIARIRIENFQSHVATELELGPGFNVIVGPSDQGKTAVLRALRWCLYNEPGGTDFIRHGARECRVEVTFSDGTRIRRERTPSRNRYEVQAPEGEPQVFEGFGVRPPAQVLRAHGMPPVALDTDHRVLLNLGGQLEGPFLLSEPPSLRAKAIGRLLGVHVVDAAARLTRRDMQNLGRQGRQLEDDVARLDEQLTAYGDLPGWEEALAAAEGRLEQAAALEQRARLLEDLGRRLSAAQAEHDAQQALLKRLQRLGDAEILVERAAAARERVERLGRLSLQLDSVSAEAQALRRQMTAAAALPSVEERVAGAADRAGRLSRLDRARGRLDQLQQAMRATQRELVAAAGADPGAAALAAAEQRLEQLTRLHGRLEQLEDVSARLAQGRQYLQERDGELRRLAHDYEHLLHRQGRCPTCFSQITPDVVRRIVRELAGPAGEEVHDNAG